MVVDKEFNDKCIEIASGIGDLLKGKQYRWELIYCGLLFYLYNMDGGPDNDAVYKEIIRINEFLHDNLKMVQ